jgi:hypothetical protein
MPPAWCQSDSEPVTKAKIWHQNCEAYQDSEAISSLDESHSRLLILCRQPVIKQLVMNTSHDPFAALVRSLR